MPKRQRAPPLVSKDSSGGGVIRIIFLNPGSQLGGAERVLLDLLAGLRKSRPDWPLLLIATGSGCLVSQAKALGVRVKVVPLPASIARLGDWTDHKIGFILSLLKKASEGIRAMPELVDFIFKIRKELKLFAPDIIHTNGFKMHICGIWARQGKTPVLWHVHDYVSERSIMKRLMGFYQHQCGAIITNSKSVEEDVRFCFKKFKNVQTVYYSVNLDQFSPEGPVLDLDALSNLLPAVHGTVKVGLLATFAKWKGHLIFLKALALIPKEIPVRGYIIGGPIYETEQSQYTMEELKKMADQCGVSDRVGFTGFVENPAAALRALDIAVHASIRKEPFGLVIVEAMACEKPVIVSVSGGSAEIIEHGENALGFPSGDPVVLAQWIQELSSQKARCNQLGKAGRQTVEKRFNFQNFIDHMIRVYESVQP